jgi:two-component system phosphate regulon response regulator PhoB
MDNTKGKILMIEDDQIQILMYSKKFSLGGYEVVAESRPEQAVATAEKEQPDIILLDLVIGMLPPIISGGSEDEKAERIEGIKILKELRKNPKTKEIPVAIFTNLDKNYLRYSGRRWKAIDYIVKANFTPSEVLKKVEELLKKYR